MFDFLTKIAFRPTHMDLHVIKTQLAHQSISITPRNEQSMHTNDNCADDNHR